MLGQSRPFTLSLLSKAVVISGVCLGSLSCLNTALQPSFRREEIMLYVSMFIFMVSSMNCSSPVPAALMQHYTMTIHLVPTTWNEISLSWSHQTTVIYVLSLLVFSKRFLPCFSFLCIIFRKGFLLGLQPCRPMHAVMHCAVYGLSTDRLTAPPLQPLKQC